MHMMQVAALTIYRRQQMSWYNPGTLYAATLCAAWFDNL